MAVGDDPDEGDAWHRLDRGTNVPGVIAGDLSEWLGTLDEAAVAQVLEVYLPKDAESFSMADAARRSGLEIERLQLFWRALGFPHVDDDAAQLTADDVELVTTFATFFVERTREQGVGLQMARVLGSNLDRIASAQVDSLVARVLLNEAAVDVSAERSEEFSELMPRLLELIWRRHLANATRRRLLRPTVGDTGTVCVGFADLVGFTAKAQQLNQLELARIVGWFEAEAYEVVTAGGGRVIKTIGDEVMFLAEDVRSGASIGVDLAERFRDDPTFPNVHVGVAAGPVIQRRGDVYGPTVNLAARIVSVALPGSVMVTEEIHDALADDPDFDFRSSFEYDLDDIGPVTLWRVRRPGTPGVASRALLAADDNWRQRFDHRWKSWEDTFTDRLRTQLLSSAEPVPERLRRALEHPIDAATAERLAADLTDEEVERLGASILATDLDPQVRVDLLTELYATRQLQVLWNDADRRVAETDDEAIQRLHAIEHETVRRIAAAEAEAREKASEALRHASVETDRVDALTRARVQQLVDQEREEEEQVRATARARALEQVERARHR
jgi:adenylate cyclase